jgi:hypothetical protein
MSCLAERHLASQRGLCSIQIYVGVTSVLLLISRARIQLCLQEINVEISEVNYATRRKCSIAREGYVSFTAADLAVSCVTEY